MTRLILIILLPFAVLAGGPIWQGQQYAFLLFAVAAVGSLMPNRWLRWFVFYAVGVTVFEMWLSMQGKVPHQAAMVSVRMCLFLGAACVFWLAAKVTPRWQDAVCVLAVAEAFLALLQLAGVDPYFAALEANFGIQQRFDLVGSFGNRNFLAAFLVCASPFLWRPVWKWGLIPVLAVILLSKSSGAYLGLVAVVGSYFKKWEVVAGAVAIGALMIAIDTPDITNRVEFWKDAIGRIAERPVFGYGPGAAPKVNFHNEYLTVIHKFGLVGLGLLALAVWRIPKTDRRCVSALLGAAVIALVSYPLSIPPTALLLIFAGSHLEGSRDLR